MYGDINTWFIDNQLTIELPPISSNQVDVIQRFKPNLEFIISLVNILKGLDKSYLYELNFSLLLDTMNKPSKELTFSTMGRGLDTSKMSQYDIKIMVDINLLYTVYKYRGYYVFHTNHLDFELIKDLTKYANDVYKVLASEVIIINKSLDGDGLIEFRENTLLKISRFRRTGDGGFCYEALAYAMNYASGSPSSSPSAVSCSGSPSSSEAKPF